MSFDGIVTKTIVAELNTTLINSKVNTIYQPNKNEILIGLYNNKKNYALKACIDATNYGVYLTTNAKPNPIVAPSFCMLLRKYLIGSRIKSITSYDLERIVKITFEGYNELNDLVQRKLIIEIMGKYSNIILVNEKGYIIDCMRHVENSTRSILPARAYEYPELFNKHSIIDIQNFNEFYNLLPRNEDTIDKSISDTFIGMSRPFLQHMLSNLNITEFNKQNAEIIYNYLKNIIASVEKNEVIATPIDDKDYTIEIGEKQEELEVNFFIDDIYYKKEKEENLKNYRNNILKLILAQLKKLTKRLENIDAKLKECDQMNLYKLYGELITANLYKYKEERLNDIQVDNYYNNEQIKIPLDNSISIVSNAKKYYKKYNKLKSTLGIVTKQKKDTQKELYYIQSVVYELEKAANIEEIDDIYNEIADDLLFKGVNKKKTKLTSNKKESAIMPIEYNVDNFKVLVGKNNKQNDYLTFKLANKNDIWFHTKDVHGSHVILKVDGKLPTDKTLTKCASIAAYYSKATQSSKVLVDYTIVKNVKKPTGAKPGMVIYNNYKTLNVQPQKSF